MSAGRGLLVGGGESVRVAEVDGWAMPFCGGEDVDIGLGAKSALLSQIEWNGIKLHKYIRDCVTTTTPLNVTGDSIKDCQPGTMTIQGSAQETLYKKVVFNRD
jgi:hypothetical protein